MSTGTVTLMKQPSIDTSEWFAVALVLACENRCCRRCSAEYLTPNPQLMVRLVNPLQRSLRSRLVRRQDWPLDVHNLSHETEITRSEIDRCPRCFAAEPTGQLLLFPASKRHVPPIGELLAKKRAELAEEREREEQRRLARFAKKHKIAEPKPLISKREMGRIKAAKLFSDL